jgi:hypothetical protein
MLADLSNMDDDQLSWRRNKLRSANGMADRPWLHRHRENYGLDGSHVPLLELNSYCIMFNMDWTTFRYHCRGLNDLNMAKINLFVMHF